MGGWHVEPPRTDRLHFSHFATNRHEASERPPLS